VKDGGLLTCLQAASGQVVFAQERLGAPGNYYASPVAADGKIYCTALNGTIVVVRAGDTLEVLARNNLGERTAATPAIVDDRLYVRTDQHLYAFGNRP
jgi:outer membrane protein assembly factor BamB